MKYLALFSLVISALTFSCKSQRPTSATESNITDQKFNLTEFLSENQKSTKVTSNESQTLKAVLIKKNQQGFVFHSMFIFDEQTQTKIFEPSERIKNCEWINDNEIKITIIPGVPTGDGTANTYIYNTLTKKKSKL